jgi:hypothetical protein
MPERFPVDIDGQCVSAGRSLGARVISRLAAKELREERSSASPTTPSPTKWS